MSATLSDEDLVGSLRTLADHALPTMSLDPAATVVAGRRRRRHRAVAGSVSAVATLALVAGVAVGAIPLPHRTPVATQAPRTLGTDPSVEVAPNIWAANAPILRTAPDGDWLDLFLSVRLDALSPTGGRSYPVGVQALDGRAGVTVAARDSDDDGVSSSLGTAATLTWSTDGADDGNALYPAAQRATFLLPEPANSDWRSLVAVLVGDVPPGLENPRVFVTYPRGVGEVVDDVVVESAATFEVPTFRAPGRDDRLLYAVRETVSVTNGIVLAGDPPPFATFVGADGTTVAGVGCGPVRACAWTADQVRERAEVRH